MGLVSGKNCGKAAGVWEDLATSRYDSKKKKKTKQVRDKKGRY